MSFESWKNYIHNKYRFYGARTGRRRKDNEFPWRLARGGVKAHLNRIAPCRSLYWNLFAEKTWAKFELDSAEPTFEVRCLLEDEISQIMYDEAVILRLSGHENFSYPRYKFDQLMQFVSVEQFSEEGYPDDYLGVPLKHFVASLPTGREIKLVAISGFIDLVNDWQQYFGQHGGTQFSPREGDVVFDCGACIGDITAVIAGMVGSSGRVHAFDPVPLHNRFIDLQAAANPELSEAFIVNQLAVGKSTTKIDAGSKGDVNRIIPGGLDIGTFEMCSLDDYCQEHNVARIDMIKMDVEGYEEDAISGAEHLIQEFRPNLAISTYHRPEHFWSIPLQIKQLNRDYRLSFGHHSPLSWESVIYAHDPRRS